MPPPGPRRAGRRPLPDLGPLEEPLGAAQLVGHARVGEGLLVDFRLRVDPVEHGDLAGRDPGGDQVADAPGDALGLGGLVPVLRVEGLGARLALGDEFEAVLGGAAARLAEQAVGEVHHLRGRAVVPHQLHHRRVRMAGAEVQQVVGGGAGERVDRLAGVADDAQAVPLAEPQLQEALLEGADVLVLVDHEVLVLAADLLGDVVPVLEDADGEQEHVLEVDHPPVALELFVRPVDLGDLGGVARGIAQRLGDRRRVVGGDGLGDLRPLDLARDVPQLAPVEPDAAAGARLRDQLDLALDQPGQLTADRLGPEVLELAQGGRVEGAGLDAARAELAQPAAHLARRAVGERDGQHTARLQDPGPYPVRDPVGDRAGLARPGAGQHAHRSVQGRRDLALLGVEAVEHRVRRLGDLWEERGVRC